MSHPSRASRPSPEDATPEPARKRSRTADVRTALVEAAWAVLEQEGLAGLTVRAAATRAGVAPMGVYNHLRDKDGLVTAVLTHAFEAFARALVHRDDLSAADALVAQGWAYRDFALAHPVSYTLMFGPSGAVLSPPATDDPDRALMRAAGERAFGQLVAGVAAAQAAGVVRPDPPDQIAFTMWSAVHGAIGLESSTRLESGTARDGYARVLTTFLRGVAPD